MIAIEDGYCESMEGWLAVLRDLKTRGMPAPALAIGDGALGFWAAIREVWPETREQRCWVHRIANVLDKFSMRPQPQAKGTLHEMMYAESRSTSQAAIHRFAQDYDVKYPKAPAHRCRPAPDPLRLPGGVLEVSLEHQLD
ncbi:MAG: transposase [Nitrospira sp.]